MLVPLPASAAYAAALRPAGWIRVIGPNPAMDRTEEIEHFQPHEVNRAYASSPRAGGKSFIVARALRRLGHQVALYGFLGGLTGQYLRAESDKLGIQDRHTTVAGDTRINSILVDRRTGRATVVNEPGPAVSADDVHRLLDALRADLQPADIVVLTGSLPPGAPLALYAELIELARARGARTIVDADGAVLSLAAEARPWAIKCNLLEFRTISDHAPAQIGTDDERDALLRAMSDVVASGVDLVIVTLGGDGLMAATATHGFHVSAPQVLAKNPTGSGDTFLAAFVAACAEDTPLAGALRHGAAAASLNAAVLVPDIGADPQLDALIADVVIQRLDLNPTPARSGMQP